MSATNSRTTKYPKRVQLSRKKGWRMPENTVKVTRPSKWGNPFRIGGYFMVGDPNPQARFKMSWCEAAPQYAGQGFTFVDDAATAVRLFEQLLARGYHKDFSELRGKNLACWCALDKPCHADVLLKIANGD